jgi:ribosomal protein L37AE/L43A
MEHDHRAEAVAEGFFFECGCGEIHRTSSGAWTCRKCREYLMDADFDDREVFDLRTGKPVARDW